MLNDASTSAMTVDNYHDNSWMGINQQKEGRTLILRKLPPLSLENLRIFFLPIQPPLHVYYPV